jgi:hypothetical protein
VISLRSSSNFPYSIPFNWQPRTRLLHGEATLLAHEVNIENRLRLTVRSCTGRCNQSPDQAFTFVAEKSGA